MTAADGGDTGERSGWLSVLRFAAPFMSFEVRNKSEKFKERDNLVQKVPVSEFLMEEPGPLIFPHFVNLC